MCRRGKERCRRPSLIERQHHSCYTLWIKSNAFRRCLQCLKPYKLLLMKILSVLIYSLTISIQKHFFSFLITAPLNNILKFKAQPKKYAFFATVNQMLGGSSQPLTTAKCAVIKSSSIIQTIYYLLHWALQLFSDWPKAYSEFRNERPWCHKLQIIQ